jgi:hypothetical protein
MSNPLNFTLNRQISLQIGNENGPLSPDAAAEWQAINPRPTADLTDT